MNGKFPNIVNNLFEVFSYIMLQVYLKKHKIHIDLQKIRNKGEFQV